MKKLFILVAMAMILLLLPNIIFTKTSATSPDDKIKVALCYDPIELDVFALGFGLTNGEIILDLLQTPLEYANFNVTRTTYADISAGILMPDGQRQFDVAYFWGGLKIIEYIGNTTLHPEFRDKVLNFVKDGGGVVGHCGATAMFSSEFTYDLEILEQFMEEVSWFSWINFNPKLATDATPLHLLNVKTHFGTLPNYTARAIVDYRCSLAFPLWDGGVAINECTPEEMVLARVLIYEYNPSVEGSPFTVYGRYTEDDTEYGRVILSTGNPEFLGAYRLWFESIKYAAGHTLPPCPPKQPWKWEQVNEEGFGDLDNDYAWSMATYKDYVYVGTLNPNAPDPITLTNVGCEVLRWNGTYDTGGKPAWEKVVGIDGTQVPFKGFGPPTPTPPFNGTNYGVRGMTVYNDLLWCGTLSEFGAQIWVTNGTRWKRANLPGFGNMTIPVNPNNRATRGVTAYKGKLYAEAQNTVEGVYIYRYDGPTNFDSIGEGLAPLQWTPVIPPGFAFNPTDDPLDNKGCGELVPFNPPDDGKDTEYLYAGCWSGSVEDLISLEVVMNPKGCEVWRYNGTTWEEIVGPTAPTPAGFGNENNGAVLSSMVFKGYLYMGTQNFVDGIDVWRTRDGINWEAVTEDGFCDLLNWYAWRMCEYEGKLIVGTFHFFGGGAEVWMSPTGDPGSFVQINQDGMNGEKYLGKLGDLIPQELLEALLGNLPETIPPELIQPLLQTLLELELKFPDQYGARSLAVFNDELYVGTASMGGFVSPVLSKNVGCEIWRTNGTLMPPPCTPTVVSCDAEGNEKHTFLPPEDVYVKGNNFTPCKNVTIYIIPNGGDRTPANAVTEPSHAKTLPDGSLPITSVWNATLELGEYDVWVDVNQNGIYEYCCDAYFEKCTVYLFLVVPEYLIGSIGPVLAMFGSLAFLRLKKKPRLIRKAQENP